MYTTFYGLSGLPFQLNPDPHFFFGSSGHEKAMAYLVYGLSQAEGFIVITGDIGAGKTTLVDHLLSTLDSSRFVAEKVVTTQLSANDMLRTIAAAFGVAHKGSNKATLLDRLLEFLRGGLHTGKRTLLMVDEAQNLSVPALEELRMLSNFESGRQTLLQSFLLGQPQFRTTLARPEVEQLRQRVIASYHLGPLSVDETRAYVLHRLRTVGWHGDPTFADDSFLRIHQHTGGVPRRINTLCSRLLLFGFLEERHGIDSDMVEKVAFELAAELPCAVPETSAGKGRAPAGLSNGMTVADFSERLGTLERVVQSHERSINQAFKIAAQYLERTKP